jgi:hypothetical protein
MAINSGTSDFEGAVKTIITQSFPFAKPAENVIAIPQIADFTNGSSGTTTTVPGSNSDRFIWGKSRMGSSSLVG